VSRVRILPGPPAAVLGTPGGTVDPARRRCPVASSGADHHRRHGPAPRAHDGPRTRPGAARSRDPGARRGAPAAPVPLGPHLRDAVPDRRRPPRSRGSGPAGADGRARPPRPPAAASPPRARDHRRARGPAGHGYTASAPANRDRSPSSSGLGRRPFKAEARVRTPLGARTTHAAPPVATAPAQPNMRLWRSQESSSPCQGEDRGIEARQARWGHRPRHGQVAQLAEHAAENRGVGSSNLPLATTTDLLHSAACPASTACASKR
jgi:hypothetical protein